MVSSQTGPPNSSSTIAAYTRTTVAGRAKASKGPRPKQGAHLLVLRQKAGLTQTELAAFLGVPQANIAFWEWSAKPPRSDVLPPMAKAFRVRIDELLVGANVTPLARRSGPVGEAQRLFDQVRALPRHHQRKILDMIAAMLDRLARRAS